MLYVLFLLLLLIGTLKGQTLGWEEQANKYLSGYMSGAYIYDSLDEAEVACEKYDACNGITYEPGRDRYTLRKGMELKDSPSGEISYIVPSEIVCNGQIGFRTWRSVYWSRGYFGGLNAMAGAWRGWEKIRPTTDNKGHVYFRSHTGSYLRCHPSGFMDWGGTSARSWERYTIVRKGNKLGFKSIHGKYVSADSVGYLNCAASNFYGWEEFTIVPSYCLNPDKCHQYLPVNDETWELDSIDYNLNEVKVIKGTPQSISHQVVNNKYGSEKQSTAFEVAETISETSSFSHSTGVSITIGTEFEVGIPLLAKGKVEMEVSTSYEYSYGNEKTTEKSLTGTFNCVAPKGKNVRCEAVFTKDHVEVPYTMVWRSRSDHDCRKTSGGVFNRVQSSTLTMHISEDK